MLKDYFNFGALSMLMIGLVLFVGIVVAKFAFTYMKGDRKYKSFFVLLSLLMTTVSLMILADNLIIFVLAWASSNIILVKMMIHKSTWKAAKESGILTAKTYALGLISLVSAFILFYIETGETSISAINSFQHSNSSLIFISLLLIIVTAMTQSAIWPFHKWLISSLNSPLPVSAIMHAGLVNGGGFLVVKFASLYTQYTILLKIIFIIGLTTAIIGTLWKLLQTDVKKMLACSTMAQMGFMLVQCGLGFFSAAVAHIILHGMFKSYLFLASGSAAKEKRFDVNYFPNIKSLSVSLLCGALGSYCFAIFSHRTWFAGDSSLVLMMISFIAGSGIGLSIIRKNLLVQLPFALIITSLAGALYGLNVYVVESILVKANLFHPQALNVFHIVGIILLTLFWLLIMFAKKIPARLYVKALNSSQPHPKTITTYRNYYQY